MFGVGCVALVPPLWGVVCLVVFTSRLGISFTEGGNLYVLSHYRVGDLSTAVQGLLIQCHVLGFQKHNRPRHPTHHASTHPVDSVNFLSETVFAFAGSINHFSSPLCDFANSAVSFCILLMLSALACVSSRSALICMFKTDPLISHQPQVQGRCIQPSYSLDLYIPPVRSD